jgi:tetratricopeptide (TPR) repeat protein
MKANRLANTKNTSEFAESDTFCERIIACQNQKQLEKLLQHPKFQGYADQNPRVRLYLAREYAFENQFSVAQQYLRSVNPPTVSTDAYWYWNVSAQLAAHLNEPFEQAFQNAREYCSGHDLGILWINQGWAYHRTGNTQAALDSWKTALEHIRFPSVAMALVDYNIGQMLLERLDPTAEFYFQRMQQITRYEVAAIQRPAAFLGLGDWHRMHRRFKQARTYYKRALNAANAHHVLGAQIDALGNLAFVAVLEHKLTEARTYLDAVKKLIPEPGTYDWVYTIEAFMSLQLGDLELTARVLNNTKNLVANSLNRASVLRAELERRLGHEKTALEALQPLDVQNIGARELVPLFPSLFTLAFEHGFKVEAILEKQRHAVVQALGTFSLIWNGHNLELPKGCDELLVYFLHYGVRETDEAIESLFWEELKITEELSFKQARVRFNKLLQRMREALQWHEVIQRKGNQYVVNHEGAIWELDWKTISNKLLKSQFLISSTHQWVRDIRDID